jgi:hypothetical protein
MRIRDMAAAQAVETKPQSALIMGRHVLPFFDNRPGPYIGEITRAAYEAQTDGVFSTEGEAQEWLRTFMARRNTD